MDICKHHLLCGGCAYQGIPYEEQLQKKTQEVRTLMAERKVEVEDFLPICPSPVPYHYRNKMEYTFGDLVKDGPLSLGMHKLRNYMSIVTVDACQLVHEDFNRILRGVLDFCTEKGYSHYHKRKHKGLLRNLVIRSGLHTDELLVNIVTTSEAGFDEEAFCACIELLSLDHKVVGILRTINDGFADAVQCDELRVLRGRDYYMERILGLNFKVSAFSFFQTNVAAVERLYRDALALLDDYSGKNVFDLFCGTGTITQALALKAAHVTGVEIVEEAVAAARENAKANGLSNCHFIAGDVFEVLSGLGEKPDTIVVDPPRAGISEKALDKIISYGVDQIIYISCGPKSLARDLYYFQYYGYRVVSLRPYDNFSFTRHVECVVLMSKAK